MKRLLFKSCYESIFQRFYYYTHHIIKSLNAITHEKRSCVLCLYDASFEFHKPHSFNLLHTYYARAFLHVCILDFHNSSAKQFVSVISVEQNILDANLLRRGGAIISRRQRALHVQELSDNWPPRASIDRERERKMPRRRRAPAILYINERIAGFCWRIKTHFCFFMSLYNKINRDA